MNDYVSAMFDMRHFPLHGIGEAPDFLNGALANNQLSCHNGPLFDENLFLTDGNANRFVLGQFDQPACRRGLT